MSTERHLSILGGGLAGLAVGHFARKHGFTFRIYEAGEEVGGNCRTFCRGDFRFDSGAHRFPRPPDYTDRISWRMKTT